MLYKIFTMSMLTLLALPTMTQATDDYNIKDYFEMFEMGAKGANHLVSAVFIAKNMTTQDLDRALHNLNNITWDLVLPIIAGIFAAKNYHTGNNTATRFATGAGTGVGAGLVAYVLGSVPKEVINKLISKATGIKHSIEDSM